MTKVLAIDHGTKRIGLAISDEEKMFAARLPAVSGKNSMTELVEVAKSQRVDTVLVGMPLGIDGKPTAQSNRVDKFVELLKGLLPNTKIVLWNETYSSSKAREKFSIKGQIDSEAARILLQEYLDFLSSGI